MFIMVILIFQIIIKMLIAHHIPLVLINGNIKWEKKGYVIPTEIMCMQNWFKLLSSKNALTFLDRNLSFPCPKIGQKWPPKYGTHL